MCFKCQVPLDSPPLLNIYFHYLLRCSGSPLSQIETSCDDDDILIKISIPTSSRPRGSPKTAQTAAGPAQGGRTALGDWSRRWWWWRRCGPGPPNQEHGRGAERAEAQSGVQPGVPVGAGPRAALYHVRRGEYLTRFISFQLQIEIKFSLEV